MAKLRHGFSHINLEDPGDWEDVPRTSEVKRYGKGRKRLSIRSGLHVGIIMIGGGYVAWVLIRLVGISGVGPEVGDEARQAAFQTLIAATITYFLIKYEVLTRIHRPARYRVTEKKRKQKVADQDG